VNGDPNPDDLVRALPARLDWLEALAEGVDVFTERFGIPVEPGWLDFPEVLPHALAGARERDEDPWGTHLYFDAVDGALIGIGGFKGAPSNGEVELGYAIAPARRDRGLATAVVAVLLQRAAAAGVTTVTAHTLAEPNASTRVLTKSGFTQTAELEDPDEGPIWRWERPTTTDA
jgi:RimJ/RimL family protein N-acetyltransferase